MSSVMIAQEGDTYYVLRIKQPEEAWADLRVDCRSAARTDQGDQIIVSSEV